MILSVSCFWLTIFVLKILLSKEKKEILDSVLMSTVFFSFIIYFNVEDRDLVFWIPALMVLVLVLSTSFMNRNNQGEVS